MEPMDRVTFVQGVFCGVLLSVLGAAVFGPGHHGVAAHSAEPNATVVTPPPTRPVLEHHADLRPRTVDLTWTDYDGTGDQNKASYVFDGKPLGSGATGQTALMRAVAELPAGSTVRVRTYYSGEPVGGVRKRYPFDVKTFEKFAENHHVTLAIPSAE